MGAAQSSAESPGLVQVSHRTHEADDDVDLAALARLPPIVPLAGRPARGFFGSAGPAVADLPVLHGRGVAALCREYASLVRTAAMPLCEEQRQLAEKMTSVDALCARILYLMALRSSDLQGSAATLRDLPAVGQRLRETRAVLQQATARAEALDALLDTLGGEAGGSLGLRGAGLGAPPREAPPRPPAAACGGAGAPAASLVGERF